MWPQPWVPYWKWEYSVSPSEHKEKHMSINRLEVAVTKDATYVLSTSVESADDYDLSIPDDGDIFRQVPSGQTVDRDVLRDHLGAQFHYVDVPTYQDPADAIRERLFDALDIIGNPDAVTTHRSTVLRQLREAVNLLKELER